MALIKCPECGKEVSDRAPACPNCGYPIENEVEKHEYKLYYPIFNESDTDLVKKFFPEVLGYTEEETQWFIDKGGLMNIACDLTLEEARQITIPFYHNNIQVYLQDKNGKTIFWCDLGMTLGKEEPKDHYYDKPVVSREHLTVITEPFEKEKEAARLEEEKRIEREKYLKEHPEEARKIEEEKLAEEQRQLAEAQAKKDNLIKCLEERKKSEIKSKAWGVVWSIAWTVICIWSFSASEEGSLGLLILLSLVCAVGGWGMLILTNGSVEQMENDIKIASKSVEEYQRLVDIRLANIKAENEKLKAEEALKHPKCPMCGSTNTQIISTLNRAVSVGMVGLASSKIGKQYECKKCKHKW